MKTYSGPARRWLGIAAAITLVAGTDARAQRATQQPVGDADEPVIVFREISGIGPRAQVATPQYRTSIPQGRVRAGHWGQITVTYNSVPEWLDEISFQYYAFLMREARGADPEYHLVRGAVTYMDIPRGRDKQSTVFLRPNTLERYGRVIGVAVEIIHRGQTIVTESQELPRSVVDGRPEWWRSPNLTARDGHILNRSQTPFAFVNFDEYETIKP